MKTSNEHMLTIPVNGLLVPARRLICRSVVMGVIALLHIGFFHVLQNGLLHRRAQIPPKAMIVTIIVPKPPVQAQPHEPQPVPPRKEPVAKRARISRAAPPVPIANDTLPETARAVTPSPAPLPVPQAEAPVVPPAPPQTMSFRVEYLRTPQLEYPASARRNGEEGQVVLRVLVNENGRPEQVDTRTSSGSPQLDQAARQAVMRALFKPHIEDGKAVAVFVMVPIKFQLTDG